MDWSGVDYLWIIVTWCDIRPSMVTHTRNLCSAINPSMWTHTPWTHTRSSGQPFMLRSPGSSRGIEGGESAVHSLPPPTIPAGPETRTPNLWITSPTLTIRPRLPTTYCDVFIRRLPFTAEDPLLRQWWNDTFLQTWWRNLRFSKSGCKSHCDFTENFEEVAKFLQSIWQSAGWRNQLSKGWSGTTSGLTTLPATLVVSKWTNNAVFHLFIC